MDHNLSFDWKAVINSRSGQTRKQSHFRSYLQCRGILVLTLHGPNALFYERS